MLSKFDMHPRLEDTMVTSTDPKRMTRGDRLAMYFTMTVGTFGIGAVAWSAVARLLDVAPGRDVPVLVPFTGERAELPIGPDGASVEVDVSQAVVNVPEPAAATQFALVAE